MNVVIVGVGTFIIACLLVIAYMCLCLAVSTKDREKIEKKLFNKRFGKGDSE
ncbi:MAG: hypothetical protein KH086_02635 [Coprobacillus sp.]|jgi:hypothetical protein|uniref:Fibroblast growth factor receptor 3 domain, fibroblast growth factor n=1 Tax=Siphoviridae sp. ctqPo10 TaxID=2827948 RepID=A0A8S5SUQ5_9CAUD|nr:hypothetical protein [Coprobacillus sp.]DAF54670.1 MAG TPA: Fibroblast growth factor receptor 3 domain, fibroblast growth factor [Siphoviridae sp. ctqPo10]DAT99516.1 MAG TPA: Fibroblast growth factor receptor 3 domain, fibroblast growth factor [Caudoviricetes sp.]